MLLIDNINIIRQTWPQTWEKVKAIEDNMDTNLCEIEQTRGGHKTLVINNGDKPCYFHSKYNPVREAKAIIHEYEDIKEESNVIFYGVGLGYHINVFLEKHPNTNFYIYEPIPEIIYAYLCNTSLKELPWKNLKGIIIGTDVHEISSFLNSYVSRNKENLLLIELPMHKKVFPNEYDWFSKLFMKLVRDRKNKIQTDYSFQKRWTINSIINFKEVLTTPNIFFGTDEHFTGKTAILVAAGPSLNEEIENLRYIKENKLAYIFSVGSAINTLIDKDILPDAVCTYDPKEENQKVFQKVNEKSIESIPMIFGSSVGYEVLQQYKGPKYHMITSQDPISNYYLKGKTRDTFIVKDAPSIAVVTLEMLYNLGFSTIILVGQNLAYRGDKQYADGIDYHAATISLKNNNALRKVKDVHGNDIYTSDTFNRMRLQMELYIRGFNGVRVINTTKGGANIEGTTFIPLDVVIKENLDSSIRIKKIHLNENEFSYNKEYLGKKNKRLEEQYRRLDALLAELSSILSKIKDLKNNQNFNQIEKMYSKLDTNFKKIMDNDYTQVFILPANRVIFDILDQDIIAINQEKNKRIKAERALEVFEKTIKVIKEAKSNFHDVFTKLHEMITIFLEGKDIKGMNIIQSDKPNSNTSNKLLVNASLSAVHNIVNDPYISIFYDLKGLFSRQYNQYIFNRMDIIVRYLAIEEYYGKNNCGYNLYKKMQKARGQKTHDLKRFKELIKSIEINGFNSNSSILVNQDMALLDGSHRVACALYFGVERIPINILPQLTNIKYSIDWFVNAGFHDDEIQMINNKLTDIIKKNAICFVTILWPPVQKYFGELTEELSQEYKILSIKDYSFENDYEFNAVVRGQYAIDDIESWKIDKKLQYMKGYNKKIRVLTMDIGNPQFRAKAKNNKPISIEVEKIKRKYRDKYSQKIDNYFYDIIMHIGDNYEHSEHMTRIMQKDINIARFLKSINSYEYALTKVDVPYMLSNFPYNYPLNKDIDVVCGRDSFKEICDKAFSFANQYLKQYEVKVISIVDNLRIRFELNNFLVYQIDISCSIKGLKANFLASALKRRIKRDGFYIFDIEDEIMLRFNEYNMNPKKSYHYSYIVNNKDHLKCLDINDVFAANKVNEIECLRDKLLVQ